MQLTLLGFGILAIAMCATTAEHRPSKFVSEKYQFSVLFPKGWAYLANQDLPIYFNRQARKMLPQGEFPKGGAEIDVLLCNGEGQEEIQSPTACRDRQVRIYHGSSVTSKSIRLPSDPNALITAFDELPLGTPGQSLRHIAIFWRVNRTIYQAQLTYQRGDPNQNRLQTTLEEIAKSFKLTKPRI